MTFVLKWFIINMFKQSYTPEQAFQKAKQYCAYQERCHSEVREKLYGYGLHRKEVDQILSKLIEENYLNEERYARQFAGGRFRIKRWGRVKIKYELKKRGVSEYCIKKALASIEGIDYMQTLQKLADSKMRMLKSEPNKLIRNRKIQMYLMQRGFEAEIVRQLIRGE